MTSRDHAFKQKKRRSTRESRLAVLQAIKDGHHRKMALLQRANMNLKGLEPILNRLIKSNLITMERRGAITCYFITLEGKIFLQSMVDFFRKTNHILKEEKKSVYSN